MFNGYRERGCMKRQFILIICIFYIDICKFNKSFAVWHVRSGHDRWWFSTVSFLLLLSDASLFLLFFSLYISAKLSNRFLLVFFTFNVSCVRKILAVLLILSSIFFLVSLMFYHNIFTEDTFSVASRLHLWRNCLIFTTILRGRHYMATKHSFFLFISNAIFWFFNIF